MNRGTMEGVLLCQLYQKITEIYKTHLKSFKFQVLRPFFGEEVKYGFHHFI
jgi:hypothetical protein